MVICPFIVYNNLLPYLNFNWNTKFILFTCILKTFLYDIFHVAQNEEVFSVSEMAEK